MRSLCIMARRIDIGVEVIIFRCVEECTQFICPCE